MTRTNVAYAGVPLWLFVLVVFLLIRRNQRLRQRAGNVTVHLRQPAGTRWNRGNGVWVDDVFAVRGGLADRNETFWRVTAATTRSPEGDDATKLGRVDDPVIATLTLADGGYVEVAFPRKAESLVLGPFAPAGAATTNVPPDLTQADLTLAAAS